MNYDDFQKLRREYIQKPFTEEEADEDPVCQFKAWFDEVSDKVVDLPNAMTLSTVSAEGQVSSRLVLLKQYDDQGFVFFTNYDSDKSQDLNANAKVSLLFYWSLFDRQIRLQGEVEKISRELSEDYFNSRPLDSQISALISPQSKEVPNREFLEKAFAEKKAENQAQLSLPNNWGGYRVRVSRFEFWQGRENRLHDRLVYKKENGLWKIHRLAP